MNISKIFRRVLAFAENEATVVGRVVSGQTGKALADTYVSLKGYHAQPHTRGGHAYTDSDGRFEIVGIPAGNYTIHVAKKGFREIPEKFGEAGPWIPPGQRYDWGTFSLEEDLRVKLGGMVLGIDGKPAVGATVHLFNAGYDRVYLNQKTFNGKVTAFLDPGDYVLLAVPPQNTPPLPSQAGVRQEVVSTFFPSATDETNAEVISLRAGQDESSCEVRLQTSRVFFLRGTVVDSDGRPSRARLLLNRQVLPDSPRYHTAYDAIKGKDLEATAVETGIFEFPTVPEGHWLLRAFYVIDRRAVMFTASIHIRQDVEAFLVELHPAP